MTSASARMSSRLTKLYDLRANWRDAARRICSRVVSARLSIGSDTAGPRTLDSGADQYVIVFPVDQAIRRFFHLRAPTADGNAGNGPALQPPKALPSEHDRPYQRRYT